MTLTTKTITFKEKTYNYGIEIKLDNHAIEKHQYSKTGHEGIVWEEANLQMNDKTVQLNLFIRPVDDMGEVELGTITIVINNTDHAIVSDALKITDFGVEMLDAIFEDSQCITQVESRYFSNLN